jgi:hypothetical protein
MGHRIAMSSSGGNLYLAYLDGNGQPWVFPQDALGNWYPKVQLGLPPGVGGFGSILGLNDIFIGLTAIDNTTVPPGGGVLYYTALDSSGNWSAFSLLANDGSGGFADFSAAWFPGPGLANSNLVVAALASQDNTLGRSVLCGMPGALQFTQSLLGPAPGGPIGTLNSSSVVASIGLPGAADYGAGIAGPVVSVFFFCGGFFLSWWWSSEPCLAGGWENPLFFADVQDWGQQTIQSIVVAQGYPGQPSSGTGTLQAILITGGPGQWILSNTPQPSGFPWVLGAPTEPFINNALPPLSVVATALGVADSGLQVIGLGPNPCADDTSDGLLYPYLFYQNPAGNWNTYDNGSEACAAAALPNEAGNGLPTPVTDLATGQGAFAAEPAIWVGYIGADGNIYANVQDFQGFWFWWGEIPNGTPVSRQPCLIVSAATGSRHSAEVRRLQEIRARIAGTSGLANQLVREIMRQYYQFSPGIAVALEKDETTRAFVLEFVVRPLVAWYSLAVAVGLERSDAKTVERHVESVLDACSGKSGGHSMAAAFEAIRSGKPLGSDFPEATVAFAERAKGAARLPYASWAIFDSLVRVWSSSKSDLIDEVAEWLAAAPVESFSPPASELALDRELETIARFFEFRPKARQQLGARLLAAWPWSAAGLKKHGFI